MHVMKFFFGFLFYLHEKIFPHVSSPSSSKFSQNFAFIHITVRAPRVLNIFRSPKKQKKRIFLENSLCDLCARTAARVCRQSVRSYTQCSIKF